MSSHGADRIYALILIQSFHSIAAQDYACEIAEDKHIGRQGSRL